MAIGPQGRTQSLQFEVCQEGFTEEAGQFIYLTNITLFIFREFSN